MGKYSMFLVVAFMLLADISYAQTGNAEKQQQISNLREVIRTSSDVAEVAKAKHLLEELQGTAPVQNSVPPATPNNVVTPQRTQQQIDIEEQRRASETLSPAEYAIWKANKTRQQNSGQSAQ